jgi:hypothetical protein
MDSQFLHYLSSSPVCMYVSLLLIPLQCGVLWFVLCSGFLSSVEFCGVVSLVCRLCFFFKLCMIIFFSYGFFNFSL